MSRLRINKMGVLSVAKIQAVIGLVVGLIVGVLYAAIILVYTLVGASLVGGDAKMAVGGGGIIAAVVALIGFPVLYTIIGFIGGAIGALVYNLCARMLGGIEMEVENI